MSKEEILDYFRHINTAYNDCSMHDSLSNMLDEFEQEAYGKGYNQGSIDRAEELQKCREYGYNKAIDEFAEEMKWEYRESIGTSEREIHFALAVIDQVAERLKGVQE